ncbi:MAG: EthD domain-containing protein [Frankia sp.]
MIKRIRFATRNAVLEPDAFAGAWRRAAGAAGTAPPDARPVRIAVCTTLADLTGDDPRHDGIALEWFSDAPHLARFRAWLDTPDGKAAADEVGRVVAPAASPVIVAEEVVLRGADWLPTRWADGGARFKHMAIALRSADLTPAEFSRRWKGHAGRSGVGQAQPGPAGADRPAPIPESVRGLAYVQNHPVARASGEWAYDALNEVYFDDAGVLRERIAWFRDNLRGRGGTDFVRRSWFLAAREEVVA